MKLKVHRNRQQLRQRFFGQRVVNVWNKLPASVSCGGFFGSRIDWTIGSQMWAFKLYASCPLHLQVTRMPYNFVADSFHTKKLCSRLSLSEVQFQTENGRFAFLSPLGGLIEATCDDHLRLIGKRVYRAGLSNLIVSSGRIIPQTVSAGRMS